MPSIPGMTISDITMSGGVDSSVAAIILKKQGYNVIGLFMRNWDSTINNDYLGNPNLNNNICPQEQDYNDALEVCNNYLVTYGNDKVAAMGIVLKINMIVLLVMIGFAFGAQPLLGYNYGAHNTKRLKEIIKFDLFVKKAKELGADYIATGHYAKLIDGKLAKAKDKNKDQSYFLAYVNKDIFKNVLFPLGDIEKPEVRKIAEEYDLITAKKKDSTGICFIGERNFTQFLENYLPNTTGDIVNIDTGEVLGKHIGLMYYTIGQRRGLNIGGTEDRMFVVKKDLDKNILYIAIGDENKYLFSNTAVIEDFNFLTDERPSKCTCKFRYRQPDINTEVEYLDNNMLRLNYVKSKAVTPGQFCVLYDGDICLGGGIIKEVK